MTNVFLLRVTAVLFLSTLVACAASGPQIQEPIVHLSGVEMTKLSLNSQTCRLSFSVNNPNPFPLPINGVRYYIQVSKQHFASGAVASDFLIPAEGDGQFDISVEIDILKSAARMTTVLRSGLREPVSYELHGSFLVDIPQVKSVPFSKSGVITIASN